MKVSPVHASATRALSLSLSLMKLKPVLSQPSQRDSGGATQGASEFSVTKTTSLSDLSLCLPRVTQSLDSLCWKPSEWVCFPGRSLAGPGPWEAQDLGSVPAPRCSPLPSGESFVRNEPVESDGGSGPAQEPYDQGSHLELRKAGIYLS